MHRNRLAAALMAAIRWLLSLCAAPPLLLGAPRSGHWGKVRDDFLAEHSTCACCGRKSETAHHVLPFHEHPELELDPNNLIAVCNECHLTFGHLGDFRAWNPLVREDAARHLAEVHARPYTADEAAAFTRHFPQH